MSPYCNVDILQTTLSGGPPEMGTIEDRPGWPYEYTEHALLVLNEVAQALHAVAKNRINLDLTRVAKNLLDQYYFLPHYSHQMHDPIPSHSHMHVLKRKT